MNSKNINVKILVSLITVVVLTIAILLLLLVRQINISANIREKIAENIALSDWPNEIPVIENEMLNITKYANPQDSEYVVWNVYIDKGVTYAAFKDYLIQLDSFGFKAVEELGCKNPKLLMNNPTMDEDFSVIWNGKSDDYGVEVVWKNINQEESSHTEDKVFTLTLYTIRKNLKNEVLSGERLEEIEHGEVFLSSGEVLE